MTKKKKTVKEAPEKEEPIEEKYTLAELFFASHEDEAWIIYNLSRKGLIQQFEQELEDYGQKHIEPTLTIREFEQIIQGEQ